MLLVSSAAQIRELDRRTIDDVGVPGVALMELAARGVADAIVRHHAGEARRGVVVVTGSGNNGGDGWAVARWLKGWGFPVRVWPLSDALKGDAAVQRDAARRLKVDGGSCIGDVGLIVDAVFGTGLARDVTGDAAAAIDAMNRSGLPIVAVDLPSGMHADTGAVLGVAVRAVRTVTFGRLKPGLLAEPGADLAGDVDVVDIGLGVSASDGDAVAEVPDADDLRALWPVRGRGDYKTRSGHLLVLAGSRNMAGAAVLACRGALAAGVGLLTLAVPRGAVDRLAALPPEVMVLQSGDGGFLEPLPEGAFAGRTAIAAGPGLGGGVRDLARPLADQLRGLWTSSSLPIVYDADALPFADGGGPGTAARVITPHPGEAGRVLGRSAADVQADRFRAAADLARDGRIALLKGRNTLVAGGGLTSVNPTNSPVLATGGAGDVLLGVVGALLARGLSGRDAARLAAYVHGRAAMLLEAERSQGWTSGDVASRIPETVESLLSL